MAAEGPVMQAERVRSCVVAEQLPCDAVRVQRDWKRRLAFLRAASISNGETTPQACKEAEIAVRTLPLAKEMGRAEDGHGDAMKELELALDKQILQDMTVLVPYPINRHVINMCCSVR